MEIYSEGSDDEQTLTEQFTVVFMTYKRHNLVKDAVAMFRGIRELHRVVIIWNDLERDPETVDELKGPYTCDVSKILWTFGHNSKVARWQNLIPSFPWIAPAIVQKLVGPNTYDLKILL